MNQNTTQITAQESAEAELLRHFDPACLLAPRLSEDTKAFLNALACNADDAAPVVAPEEDARALSDSAILNDIACRLSLVRALTLSAANFSGSTDAETAADQYEIDAAIDGIARLVARVPEGSFLLDLSPERLGILIVNGRTLTLSEVVSGGRASLRVAPALALRIVRRAQEEVTFCQEQLQVLEEAVAQSNLLALEATLGNILQTETYLRDQQAALACANQTSDEIRAHALTGLQTQSAPQEEAVLALLCD